MRKVAISMSENELAACLATHSRCATEKLVGAASNSQIASIAYSATMFWRSLAERRLSLGTTIAGLAFHHRGGLFAQMISWISVRARASSATSTCCYRPSSTEIEA
jgi:hypothetical protein